MEEKKQFTFGEILDLLDLTAEATMQEVDGKFVKIEGELEEKRIQDVKMLEDYLVIAFRNCDMFRGGINYIRKYEHMYKHLL